VADVIVERIRAVSAIVAEVLSNLGPRSAGADLFEARQALLRARGALVIADLAVTRHEKSRAGRSP
jgi:hypothetical protein